MDKNLIESIKKLKPTSTNELGELLRHICDYGRPSLFLLESGWHCKVVLNTSREVTGSVSGPFGVDSPEMAAATLLEKLRGLK